MAGIVVPITEILARLSDLEVPNLSGYADKMFSRIWNNQIENITEGKLEFQKLPAAYVEVISPSQYMSLGLGYSTSDITFRVHVIHEEYDAGDGTMEQNINVFAIRDKVIGNLNGFKPSFCGTLAKVSEEQDYSHTNLYHYIIDFVAAFIDDSGSDYRDDSGKFTQSVPPLELEVDVTIEKSGKNQLTESCFIINKQ